MASRVGTLYVDLIANTKQFIDELDKSRTKSATFGVTVGSIMADVTRSVTRMAKEAALALPRLVKQQIDFADNLNKSAQRTGVAVEQLSALGHAAELSDVSFGSLETGLQRFNRTMFEAGTGSKAQAAAFNEIGVSVKNVDGRLRPTIDVLGDVADIFAQMPNSAEKTARAIELFGRAGADLIPLLNAGKAGLQGFADEAERLGLIISSETAQRAEEFNDNLTRLKDIGIGLGNSLASVLLPALEGTSRLLLDARDSADKFFERVGVGAPNIKAFAGFLHTLNVEQLEFLRIRGLSLIGESAAANDKERLQLLKKNQEEIEKMLQRLTGTTDTAKKQFAEAGKEFSKSFDLSGLRKELESAGSLKLPKVFDERLLTPEQKKKLEDERKDAEKANADLVASFNKGLRPASAFNKQLLTLTAAHKSAADFQRLHSKEITEAIAVQRAFGQPIETEIALMGEQIEIRRQAINALREELETHFRLRAAPAIMEAIRLEAAKLPATIDAGSQSLEAMGAALESIQIDTAAAESIAELDDAFERLGLKSGFVLSGIAAQASKDFVAVSTSGQASARQISEAFVAAQEAIRDAARAGFGVWNEEQQKALQSAQADLDKFAKQDELKAGFRDVGVALSSGIEEAMRKWEGFGKLVTGILDDIAATILRNAVTAPLSTWLGTVFAGLGGLIGGPAGSLGSAAGSAANLPTAGTFAFAEGGEVAKGMDALVGDLGTKQTPKPELYIPDEFLQQPRAGRTEGAVLPTDKPPVQFHSLVKRFSTENTALTSFHFPKVGIPPVPRGTPFLIGTRGPEIFKPPEPGTIVPLNTPEGSKIYEQFKSWGRTREHGGPVGYMTGERGREMFLPASMKAGGGSGGVNNYITINAPGAEVGVEQRIMAAFQQAVPGIVQASVNAVEERKRRGI